MQLGAFFDFSRLLVVILLTVCTCAYLHEHTKLAYDWLERYNPAKNERPGVVGMLWKFARIGERKSAYVAGACLVMAFHLVFLKDSE